MRFQDFLLSYRNSVRSTKRASFILNHPVLDSRSVKHVISTALQLNDLTSVIEVLEADATNKFSVFFDKRVASRPLAHD